MIISRFAPSPTGRLHLGHAYSAVLGNARARQDRGKFLLRIEDLDQTRSRPEYVGGIQEDLRWLGLDWDDEPIVQSRRVEAYVAVLDQLRSAGLIYPCFCTRADIVQVAAAPHGDPGLFYPGTCRGLPDDAARRASTSHSWRLDSGKAVARVRLPGWAEADGAQWRATEQDIGDAILARKDAPAAYHLACVVDDAASGVTLVVRGIDLRPSTPIQRLLQELLGLPAPHYLHHKLVLYHDGRRLAKRDLAPTLAAMRESGVDGRALAENMRLGLLPGGFRLGTP